MTKSSRRQESFKLIDMMYLENHCPYGKDCCFSPGADQNNCNPGQCWCPSRGQAGNTNEQFQAALATMQQAGVTFPDYYTPTL